MTGEQFLEKRWLWLLILGIVVNGLGLFSPILEPDGALYATIAKHMVLSGDYYNLSFQGKDWLDKPHFPFWITAISYLIFGINTIGYKMPALLFWGIGIYYTYRFASLFYSKTTARLSTLIYVTAFHLVLSNNDVRAEPYLTGLIMAAMFHCYVGIANAKLHHLIIGALFAACAVMTKGIFVLIIIFSGLVLHWILKKQFSKSVFHRLAGTMLLILVFTTPEVIALYLQFDIHPEKIVFGHTRVSGVKFFLWDSQFGRFFNTGPIQGEGDPFFFLHTSLWAFFPWSIAFFASSYVRIRHWTDDKREKIIFLTIVTSFLLFSFSKFQLPHYLNVIFPLMSIQVAHFILTINKKHEKYWNIIFLLQVAICIISIVFLCKYSLPNIMYPVTLVMIGCIIFTLLLMQYEVSFLVRLTILSSLILYTFISLFFVPTLMKYQAGSEAAFFLTRTKRDSVSVAMLRQDGSCSFDFYYPDEVRYLSIEELSKLSAKPWIFCNEKSIPVLQMKGLVPEVIKAFPYYKVSQPSAEFMNGQTRDQCAQYYFLIKIR